MESIKAIYSNDYTKHYYHLDLTPDDDLILEISAIRNTKGFKTNFIKCIDFYGKLGECDDSIKFDADASLNDMRKGLCNRSIDIVMLNGDFEDKPVTLSLDLLKKRFVILTDNDEPADVDKLERLLQLSRENL